MTERATATKTPKGRSSNGREQRRQELVEIAAQLFAEQGFDRATMRALASRADMLVGSLYYHFASKEDLAEEIVESYYRRLFAVTDAVVGLEIPASEKLGRLIEETFLVDEEMHSHVRVLITSWHLVATTFPQVRAYMRTLEARWLGVLRQGIDEGTFRSDIDVSLVYRSIMASISGINRWYQPGKKIPMVKIAAAQRKLWLAAVQDPPAG